MDKILGTRWSELSNWGDIQSTWYNDYLNTENSSEVFQKVNRTIKYFKYTSETETKHLYHLNSKDSEAGFHARSMNHYLTGHHVLISDNL